jgi:fatty acid-binding protein DegV
MHANCAQDAQAMVDELNFMLRPEVMMISELGAGMGALTGPGALGVGWYVPSGEESHD